MAGQFDKYVKILGNSTRPDRFLGAPGNPDIVAPIEVPEKSTAPIGGKDTNITQAAVNVAKGRRENAAAGDLEVQRKVLRGNARKRQIAGLSTTTMRLNEQTDEAYDSSEVVPPKAKPDYVISGTHPKRPKRDPNFKASVPTDSQVAELMRPGGSLIDQKNAAKSAQEAERQDLLSGENAFNERERSSGSTTRSLNGVTYDVADRRDEVMAATGGAGDYGTYQADLEKAAAANDVIPASTIPAKTSDVEEPKVFSNVKPSGYKPTESAGDLAAKKADALLTQGAKIAAKKEEKEGKNPRRSRKDAPPGGVPKYKEGPRNLIGSEAITAPDTDVVDEGMPEPKLGEKGEYTGITTKGSFDPYNEDGTLSSVAQEGILSTTMREVASDRPDKVLGHVPVLSPRELAGYEKPTVNKSGNVIPPMAIDTFGAQPADRKQAEAENARLRKNRSTPVVTTIFDPNVRSARPARGKTPEATLIAASKREVRAKDLASQGKEMTTVSPEVMDIAKRLGRTSMYNLTDHFMNQTGFLAHPAIQKATVAHALGVHHTLGTDTDHLHAYLGGRPLEASSRLAAAYKVVDRHLRGNPEKIAGEFKALRGMVHAGSSPQQTLRSISGGNDTGVTIDGQSPTLAPTASIANVGGITRAGTRAMHANTAANVMYEQQQARAKVMRDTNGKGATPTFTQLTEAHASKKISKRLGMELNPEWSPGSLDPKPVKTKKQKPGAIAGTPTAPLAGNNRVAVRRIGQKPDEAQIREFTPRELLNKQNVPGPDDSKGVRIVDVTAAGLKPGEKDTNKTLKEEKDS